MSTNQVGVKKEPLNLKQKLQNMRQANLNIKFNKKPTNLHTEEDAQRWRSDRIDPQMFMQEYNISPQKDSQAPSSAAQVLPDKKLSLSKKKNVSSRNSVDSQNTGSTAHVQVQGNRILNRKYLNKD